MFIPRRAASTLVGGIALLLLVPTLHCDSAPTRDGASQSESRAPAPPEAEPPPSAEPEALDPNDPQAAAKAAIAAAQKNFEDAKNPVDTDVFRVEYTLLLRSELEKLGLKKSSLSRLSLADLQKLARKKGLLK